MADAPSDKAKTRVRLIDERTASLEFRGQTLARARVRAGPQTLDCGSTRRASSLQPWLGRKIPTDKATATILGIVTSPAHDN